MPCITPSVALHALLIRSKILIFNMHQVMQVIWENMSYELQVTSYAFKFERPSSNARVMSSDLRVSSSNPRVTSSSLQV